MGVESGKWRIERCKAAYALCASAVLVHFLPTVGTASEDTANLRIIVPERPLQQSCFQTETESHRGAISIEEIEGEAIDGFGYGNVQAQAGESWGYWFSVQGQLDGAFLTVKVTTLVDGSELFENKQWAFVAGGIATHVGAYFETDCPAVEQEFTRRIAQ